MMPEQAANNYPVDLLDVAKKAKEASGASKPIILEFSCLACVYFVSIPVECTSMNIEYYCLTQSSAQQLELGFMSKMP